jgi:hypothetical protein
MAPVCLSPSWRQIHALSDLNAKTIQGGRVWLPLAILPARYRLFSAWPGTEAACCSRPGPQHDSDGASTAQHVARAARHLAITQSSRAPSGQLPYVGCAWLPHPSPPFLSNLAVLQYLCSPTWPLLCLFGPSLVMDELQIPAVVARTQGRCPTMYSHIFFSVHRRQQDALGDKSNVPTGAPMPRTTLSNNFSFDTPQLGAINS